MEQGMLMVCDAPENPSLTKLMHVYFGRRMPSKPPRQHPGQPSDGGSRHPRRAIDRINAYGTIEDMVTQEGLRDLGQERVSKRRTGGKLEAAYSPHR